MTHSLQTAMVDVNQINCELEYVTNRMYLSVFRDFFSFSIEMPIHSYGRIRKFTNIIVVNLNLIDVWNLRKQMYRKNLTCLPIHPTPDVLFYIRPWITSVSFYNI